MLGTVLNNSLHYTSFCQFQLLVLYLLSKLLDLRIKFEFPEFLLTICFYYLGGVEKKDQENHLLIPGLSSPEECAILFIETERSDEAGSHLLCSAAGLIILFILRSISPSKPDLIEVVP